MEKENIFTKFKDKHLGGLSYGVLAAIFILAAADAFTMAAPYYLKLIVVDVYSYMGINQSQFDLLGSILGYVTLATQLPGGWLADKVSSKKLLTLSLIITGVLTVWWGLLIQGGPNGANYISAASLMPMYIIIYASWGVSTTLVFWTPLWKLLSQQSPKEKQGLSYGLEGTFNGFIGLIFLWAIGFIATSIVSSNLPSAYIAFPIFVWLIGGLLILTAFAVLRWVKERPTKDKFAIDVKTMWSVMKEPRVWLCSIFVLGLYMFQSVFAYYFKDYMANVILYGVVGATIIVTVLSGFRTYLLRMFVSTPIGKWADKKESYIVILFWTLVAGIVIATLFIFLPGFGSIPTGGYLVALEVIIPILFIVSGILSWIMVTLRYTQIVEIPTTPNSYACTTALISFVAFSSDSWFYTISSEVGKNYLTADGGYTQQGYQIILGIALGVTCIGLISGGILIYWNRHEMKKLGKTSYRWRDLNNG